jgi:hypothetical protein
VSNWIAITKADLYNSKVAALIDAANTTSLGAGQTDRTTGVMADVTLEIRRKIARVNLLDSDTTKIPGGLKPLAIDIIFCRLKVALEMELTEDERKSLARRENELDRIADGKDFVDPPDNPVAANMEQGQPSPSFGDKPHRRKNELNG